MSSRNTVQRQVIFNAVKELKNHPTSEDVYNHIKPEYPSISLGTVYRNLNLLAESNEIKKVAMLDTAVRFDHETKEHYHFQCKDCGMLSDIFIDYEADLNSKASSVCKSKVERHDIIFVGKCEECVAI